jgi:hypothetical protein
VIGQLLNTEGARRRKEDAERDAKRVRKAEADSIVLHSDANGIRLTLPLHSEPSWYRGVQQTQPSARAQCSNCSNAMKYRCSTNSMPVCSLQCYKQVSSIVT